MLASTRQISSRTEWALSKSDVHVSSLDSRLINWQVEPTGGDNQQETHSRSSEERHFRDDGRGPNRGRCRSSLCHVEAAQIDSDGLQVFREWRTWPVPKGEDQHV